MTKEKSLYREIGQRLKTARERTGLTQTQVAAFLGIQREVISYFENGTREIGVDDLLKLANLYGVDPHYFIGELKEGEEIEGPCLSLAFRAKQISESDLPVIAEAQRFLNNLYQLTMLLEGEGPSGYKAARTPKGE